MANHDSHAIGNDPDCNPVGCHCDCNYTIKKLLKALEEFLGTAFDMSVALDTAKVPWVALADRYIKNHRKARAAIVGSKEDKRHEQP